jgi:hypothetical protein
VREAVKGRRGDTMLISLDFESNSLQWWRPSFEVKSAAFSYRKDGKIVDVFVDDKEELRDRIVALKGHQVLCYNASFDISIIRKHFPDAWPLDYVDVMRLRQLRSRVEKVEGYGLKAAVKRFLPHMAGYENEIKAWIAANVPECKKGKEGQHYDKAPRALLESYNVADARATLLLFEQFYAYFLREGFDWQKDHELYTSQVDFLYEATLRGIDIDRGHLERFISQVNEEVGIIDTKFQEAHEEAILTVRETLRQKKQASYKKKIVTELPEFNTGSKQHLEML